MLKVVTRVIGYISCLCFPFFLCYRLYFFSVLYGLLCDNYISFFYALRPDIDLGRTNFTIQTLITQRPEKKTKLDKGIIKKKLSIISRRKMTRKNSIQLSYSLSQTKNERGTENPQRSIRSNTFGEPPVLQSRQREGDQAPQYWSLEGKRRGETRAVAVA